MKLKNRTKWVSLIVIAILFAIWILFPIGCSIVGIRTSKEANHQVLSQHGQIQIREYDELVIVETNVDAATYNEAGNIALERNRIRGGDTLLCYRRSILLKTHHSLRNQMSNLSRYPKRKLQ